MKLLPVEAKSKYCGMTGTACRADMCMMWRQNMADDPNHKTSSMPRHLAPPIPQVPDGKGYCGLAYK